MREIARVLGFILPCSLLIAPQTFASAVNGQTVEASIQQVVDTQYLASPEWLATNYIDSNVLVLDARDSKSYLQGHIPRAINVQWKDFADVSGSVSSGKWGTVLPPVELAAKFTAIGLTKDTDVIIYADNKEGWGEDGRFVWMLKMAGFNRARMLDGGINAWRDLGYPMDKTIEKPVPGNLTFHRYISSMSIDTPTLASRLGQVKILDTRTREEFNGTKKYGEARGGHLPGAIHFDFHELFGDNMRIKPKSEIEKLLAQRGITKEDTLVAYCTAGIRSAEMAMVLGMYGYNVTNYAEGFYAWAASNYPVGP